MARLPLIEPEAATGEAKLALEAVPAKLNIFKMMAHAETTIAPQLRLGAAILTQQKLGHVERELLILLVAKLEGGEYEWVQHVPIAKGVGATEAQIAAIEALDLTADAFSDAERALLAFGRQTVETVRVEPSVFTAVRAHFSSQEIVEAILAMGFYMTMARLTEATETDLDAAAGMTVFDKAQEGVDL